MGTVILAIVLLLATSSSTVSGDDKLHIFALPVGQGDATIIKCPDAFGENGKLTVIDMGWSACTVDNCMNTEKAIKDFISDHKVDQIFLTHPDKDHYNLITALTDNLDEYVTIYHTHDKECYQHDGKAPLQALLDLNSANQRVIAERVDRRMLPQKLSMCFLHNIKIWILASELNKCCGDNNEDSLVLQLKAYNKYTALFVGDLEGHAVDELVDGFKIKSFILRLAHHGSRSNKANSDKFLNAVNPTVAFSSSDPGHDSFHHPHCQILEWFKNSKDKEATEHPYICDGKTYTTNLKYELYQTTVMDQHGGNVKHYIIDFRVDNKHIYKPILKEYVKNSIIPITIEDF